MDETRDQSHEFDQELLDTHFPSSSVSHENVAHEVPQEVPVESHMDVEQLQIPEHELEGDVADLFMSDHVHGGIWAWLHCA